MPVRRKLDCAFLVVLLFGGFVWATVQLKPETFPYFYQDQFAPAVMRAMGYGFVDPVDNAAIPGLAEFLEPRAEPLAQTGALEPLTTRAPNGFQAAHRYLLESAAICWRMLGISWANLWPLYGTLFGLLAVGAYLVCRTAVSPALALAGSVATCLSVPVTTMLPHLRDFSRAPFILLCVAMCVLAVRRRRAVWPTVLWSALGGAAFGIGLGFRQDLIVTIPPAATLLLGFNLWRGARGVFCRALSCVAFGLASVVLALPILGASGETRGRSFWHWINAGLLSYFDPKLNLDTPSTHELGHYFNDMFLGELINDYGFAKAGVVGTKLTYLTQDYNTFGREYFLDVCQTFPADVAIRICAAPLQAYGTWPFPRHPELGCLCVLLAVSVLLAKGARLGMVAILMCSYFGGLVFLQFELKHYFYLAIVPVLGACIIVQELINVTARRSGGPWQAASGLLLVGASDATRTLRRGFLIRVGVLGLAGASLCAIIGGLRWCQRDNVAALLDRLGRLPRVSCDFDQVVGSDTVTFAPVSQDQPPPIGARLWLLELCAPNAPGMELVELASVRLELGCGGEGPYGVDHSRELLLPLQCSGPGHPILRYVFFTLNAGCVNPTITLDSEFAPLVTQFCELDRRSADPLLVNAQLPLSGVAGIPYQTLGRSASREPVHAPRRVMRDRIKLDLSAWSPSRVALFEELPASDSNGQWRVFRTVVTGGAGRRALAAPAESVAPGIHRITVVAKAGNVRRIQIAGSRGTEFFANFDLHVGAVTRRGRDTPNATVESLGGGWYRLSADFWWRWNRQDFPFRQLVIIDGARDPAHPASSCEGFLYLAVPRYFPRKAEAGARVDETGSASAPGL